MFSKISWGQYLSFILIVGGLYYTFIWLVFYKGKFPSLSRLGNFQTSLQEEDEISDSARHIMDELSPLFKTKNKAELIMALKHKLRPYSNWDQPGFRQAVDQYIATQSEAKCSIHLSVSDLSAVWS